MDNIEIITEKRFNGRQDYVLDRTVKVGTSRLRIEVRRDAYDFQSYARISLWDGTKWNIVDSLSGTESQMVAGPSYVVWNRQRAACEQWQDDVAERLLITARAVIE